MADAGDLQTRLLTDLGQSLTALDRVTDRIGKMEARTRQANRAMRDLQQQASKGLTVGEGFANTGKALNRVGGGVFGRVLGGAGMDGIFGKLAVGAGIAAVAFRVFSSVMEQNLDRVRAATEAHKEYTKAIESGQKIIEGQVKAGLARAPMHRKLLAAGGTAAVEEANRVAGEGILSVDDAESVTQQAFARYGNKPGRALQAIRSVSNLVAAGMSTSDATSKVLEGHGLLDNPTNAARLETSIYDGSTKRPGSYAQAGANLSVRGGDMLLDAAQVANQSKAKIAGIETARAGQDRGITARREAESAVDPVITALADMKDARESLLAAQQRVAFSENNFSTILKDLGGLLGGQGSERSRLENQRKAFGDGE